MRTALLDKGLRAEKFIYFEVNHGRKNHETHRRPRPFDHRHFHHSFVSGNFMSTSHTPGPWEAIRASHGIVDVFGSSGFDIVTLYGMNAEQNARLIAAAPELLEALEYALPYLKACVPNPRNGINADYSVDVNCVDRAIAAIAKATGAA